MFDNLFYYNIFALWDFVYKSSILQIANLCSNPEKLDADFMIILKLFLLSNSGLNNFIPIYIMMQLSLIDYNDLNNSRFNDKIMNDQLVYFNNTHSDISDQLVYTINNTFFNTDIESILKTFENIINFV